MKRVDYLDNLSGLLICYMMLYHILLRGLVDCSVDNIWLEPLQFFMFWFFFKSGMFYVPKNSRQILSWGGHKAHNSIAGIFVYRAYNRMCEIVCQWRF